MLDFYHTSNIQMKSERDGEAGEKQVISLFPERAGIRGTYIEVQNSTPGEFARKFPSITWSLGPDYFRRPRNI
jgi:hypothetical protein